MRAFFLQRPERIVCLSELHRQLGCVAAAGSGVLDHALDHLTLFKESLVVGAQLV
jgi:hypothetical protein